ncbi:MAG: hypothetical protein D6814_05075 [Calditrichaeota bacterium]|nr:MAG: hypothetical protein D6814_05075 [Calditrichota bacterium]
MPYIKSQAMEILDEAADATSEEEAMSMIQKGIQDYYTEEYPDLAKQRKEAINQAIAELQEIYRKNFFPYMRANWKAYPQNIGHLTNPGCYRCHDGMHQTEDGQVITNDCTTCHIIIEQGNGKDFYQADLNGLEFKHPVDIEEAWKDTGCYECHGI